MSSDAVVVIPSLNESPQGTSKMSAGELLEALPALGRMRSQLSH
jgi:hypothetical protein